MNLLISPATLRATADAVADDTTADLQRAVADIGDAGVGAPFGETALADAVSDATGGLRIGSMLDGVLLGVFVAQLRAAADGFEELDSTFTVDVS